MVVGVEKLVLALCILDCTLLRQVEFVHDHALLVVRDRDRVVIKESISIGPEQVVLILQLHVELLLRNLHLLKSALHLLHVLL